MGYVKRQQMHNPGWGGGDPEMPTLVNVFSFTIFENLAC